MSTPLLGFLPSQNSKSGSNGQYVYQIQEPLDVAM
jgi:hypothetical protein